MTRSVLVVDDAATVRMYYRQVLAGLGCVVEEAWNGIEGLEKALSAPPDLMLVDVNMPRLDGFGMMHRLRREPGLQAIPAIMISTEAGERTLGLAAAAGANLFVVKPVRPERLLGLARVMLGMPPA